MLNEIFGIGILIGTCLYLTDMNLKEFARHLHWPISVLFIYAEENAQAE